MLCTYTRVSLIDTKFTTTTCLLLVIRLLEQTSKTKRWGFNGCQVFCPVSSNNLLNLYNQQPTVTQMYIQSARVPFTSEPK